MTGVSFHLQLVWSTTVLTCSGSATDADGGTPSFTYAWNVVGNTTVLSTTDTSALRPRLFSPDEVRCVVTATDAEGDADQADATVDVENRAPVISAIVISPATGVKTKTALTCTVTASDADGTTTSVSTTTTGSEPF